MPDSCDQLRAQIRALQGERRSLESKLMQPQGMLAASLVGGTLPARRWHPTSGAGVLPIPLRARSFDADVCQEGRAGCGAAALRRLPRLPAESEAVAAGHRSPATAVEAIAAGPVPIKTFLSFFVDFAGHSTAGVSQIEGMMGSAPRPVT